MNAPQPVNSDLFLPNFSAIAGFYSQLAGVLAGFAFAGLIALLAAQLSSPGSASAALKCFVPLISSFKDWWARASTTGSSPARAATAAARTVQPCLKQSGASALESLA